MGNNKTFNADVIVVGGGIAGSLAAISAARSRTKVILIERESYLGGTATSSMMGQMTGAGMNGKAIFGGISAEFVNTLIQNKDAQYAEFPMRTKKGTIMLLRYNVESFKSVLDDFVVAAGTRVFFNSVVESADESDDFCSVQARGLYDRFKINGKVLVDATGNASVAGMLKHETFNLPREQKQAVAIIFKLGNVDNVKLDSFDAWSVWDDWYVKGYLPARFIGFAPSPNTNETSVNVTMLANVDHESTEDISRALIELRKQIRKLVPFLRDNVPGLEQCFLSSVSPALGVRDARRIVVKYILSGNDIMEMRNFEDAVAPGAWPVDVHDPSGNMIWVEPDNPYKIPYSTLIPKRGGRLITAGKCISADDEAFAAIRVIPTAIGIGEAAGDAAAQAVKTGKTFDQIDGKLLCNILRQKGVQV